MRRCPITLEPVDSDRIYSLDGLKSVHPRLTDLKCLEISHDEQLKQARLRADKMSIQGVQPKVSAVLRLKKQKFELVDKGGKFILKPNPPQFEEVPENEALTMRMAMTVGIEVPAHGLLHSIDDSWVYFVKRFDRIGRARRIHIEDFAQLSGSTRETKYDSSLEQVAKIIDTFCTFPAIEKPKLAMRLLFCFLTGNEDMHLKNFSLRSYDGVVSLTPAYDLLNTTLILENTKEESALSLMGKRNRLNRKLWIEYFCIERLGLNEAQVDSILLTLKSSITLWEQLIKSSYLSEVNQKKYNDILSERCVRLEF
tara:strand:+ start:1433 stop:2365 length:933 start_codon:yes stop_codon:yes gene_type:complete